MICGADNIALGILLKASAGGLKVPADLGVISFGNSDPADATSPTLTTIRVDAAEIGQRISEVMEDRRGGNEPRTRRIEVGYVWRMGEYL